MYTAVSGKWHHSYDRGKWHAWKKKDVYCCLVNGNFTKHVCFFFVKQQHICTYTGIYCCVVNWPDTGSKYTCNTSEYFCLVNWNFNRLVSVPWQHTCDTEAWHTCNTGIYWASHDWRHHPYITWNNTGMYLDNLDTLLGSQWICPECKFSWYINHTHCF